MKLFHTFVLVGALFQLVCSSHAELSVALPGRTINKMLPDYGRPKIYALNQANGSAPGTLLALNPTNGSVLSEIPLNLNPTDMNATSAGDALYVINAGSRTIMKVDLSTFTVTRERGITTPQSYNPANPLYVVAGAAGRLHFTDGGWGPSIYSFDFEAGTQRIVYDTGGNGIHGAGGITLNRNGDRLYIWNQYGWNAGNEGSWVTRFDVAGSGSLTSLDNSFASQRRTPFDTPLFLDSAERWVFNKQQMFMATNVSVLVNQFTDNIYGISLDGSIAFGPSKVFNTVNGSTIATLPFSTTVMTLSGDQKKLFRYQPANASVVIYDMETIASVNGPNPTPTPADGSVVSPPLTNLTWTPSPVALAYDVYWGTNKAEVAAATIASPLHLGRVTVPSQALPGAIASPNTYYWRLDVAGFSTTNAGPVWSFTTSPLEVHPAQIKHTATARYNPANVTLSLTGASPLAWSATVTGGDWLSVNPSSATSPGNATVAFNTAALTAGSYSNNINFTIGASTLSVPVSLTVTALNIRKMVADPQRPYFYAIQPPNLPDQSGSLFIFSAINGNIEKTLPIGINPVDLCVSRTESKLYIANWGQTATDVVDLQSQTLLPPLNLGADVYKINAGRPGRIVVEGLDQWIGVKIVDSATGAVLGALPWPSRQGDGEFDSTGTVYYHSDDNISNAHIHKYLLTNDVPTEVSDSPEHAFGSRNLILSPNDQRLFWRGYVYDADLNELGSLGAEIYACSTDGRVAFSDTHAYDSQTRNAIYTLPTSSTVSVVDQQNQRYWYFANGLLDSIPLSVVQSPSITSSPAPDTAVSVGGSLYLTVTAVGVSPLSYQWMRAGVNLPGETNHFLSILSMQPAQVGNYHVVVSNPFGAVTSSVAEVKVLIPPSLTAQPASTNVMAGRSFTLSVTPAGSSPLSYQWLFENSAIVGATSPTITIQNAQSANEGIYRIVITNSAGSVTSAAAFVRVLPSAPVILGEAATLVVGASSNAVLRVQAAGSQPLDYQWLFHDLPLPGATGPQLSIINAQSVHQGDYRVMVSNSLGTASSLVVSLEVLPVVPYFTEQPVGATLIAGSTLTVTGRANGTQPISYQWQRNGTNLPGAVSASLRLNSLGVSDSGSYTLVASNAVGVSTSSVALLTVFQNATLLRALSHQVVQAGDTVTLVVEADGSPPLTYSWQRNGEPVPGTNATLVLSSLQPAQSGFYRVSVANRYGTVSSSARVSVVSAPGTVLAWGDNSGGQTNVPAGLDGIVAVAGGDYHTLALRRDGTLMSWGYNGDGQTAVPTSSLRIVTIAAGGSHNLAITEAGRAIGWGRNDYGQRDIPAAAADNVLAIAAGESHSLALFADGSVAAWGDNTHGQSSVPGGLFGVRAIAAGHNHSLALRTNGTVVGWGFNLYGQATAPSALTNAVAVAGGYLHSLALRADGMVVSWGDNSFGQTNVPAGLTNVVAIAAGDFHSLALQADGTIFGWGDNSYSQLRIPISTARSLGINSGFFHGLALVPTIRLTVRRTADGVVVSSSGSGKLQWAPTISGPFDDILGYTGSYTNVDTTAPTRFYRLRQ